jgi:hypothetical protein
MASRAATVDPTRHAQPRCHTANATFRSCRQLYAAPSSRLETTHRSFANAGRAVGRVRPARDRHNRPAEPHSPRPPPPPLSPCPRSVGRRPPHRARIRRTTTQPITLTARRSARNNSSSTSAARRRTRQQRPSARKLNPVSARQPRQLVPHINHVRRAPTPETRCSRTFKSMCALRSVLRNTDSEAKGVAVWPRCQNCQNLARGGTSSWLLCLANSSHTVSTSSAMAFRSGSPVSTRTNFPVPSGTRIFVK